MDFKLHAPYQPTGDQPAAIASLVAGLRAGDREQTLLGVTGSGKTFTTSRRWYLPTTRRWLLSSVPSSRSFSLRTRSSILSPIMIITSRRRISPVRIPISRRTRRSMMRSTSSAIRRPVHCPNGGTLLLSRVYPVSIRSVRRSITKAWSFHCGPVWNCRVTSCSTG